MSLHPIEESSRSPSDRQTNRRTRPFGVHSNPSELSRTETKATINSSRGRETIVALHSSVGGGRRSSRRRQRAAGDAAANLWPARVSATEDNAARCEPASAMFSPSPSPSPRLTPDRASAVPRRRRNSKPASGDTAKCRRSAGHYSTLQRRHGVRRPPRHHRATTASAGLCAMLKGRATLRSAGFH